jgi:hypothetical protein
MARESYVWKKRPDGVGELVQRNAVSDWMEKHWGHVKSKAPKIKVKAVQRGSWVWRDGKLVERNAIAPIRGKSRGLQIIKDCEPFLNVAIDNGYIGGRKQRRDMMRAHGLVEIGNEKPQPSPREIANERRKRPDASIVAELKRASQGKWL